MAPPDPVPVRILLEGAWIGVIDFPSGFLDVIDLTL
jgi:hypothetical protein